MDNDLLTRARDVGFTAVGFGVLAVQRLQVQRRELARDLGERIGGRAGVARFVDQVEAAVDPVLDDVEKRLPEGSRVLVHRARQASRIVRHTLLN